MTKLRLIAVTCLTLALGCNDFALMDTTPPEPSGSVWGTVRGLSGERIGGATILIGDRTVSADANGQFLIEGLAAGATHDVFAHAEGWSTGHQRVAVTAGAEGTVEIVVAPALESTISDAAMGGLLQGSDGVAIDFPAGAFVHADGQPVSGEVTVRWSLLNTVQSVAAAPGGMQARTDADPFPLESFGMVEVELSQGGVEVELAVPATLSIPLAATASFDEGESVGLWHFDEEQGLWTLEGEGTIDDGMFVAEVPHFSWWNCDQPQRTTCVEGTLLTPDNTPYIGLLQSTGVDYMGTASTLSNESGRFLVTVRSDSVARLTLEPPYGVSVNDFGLDWSFPTNPTATGTTNCSIAGILVLEDLRVDDDADGVTLGQGDCDDADPTVYPGATEVVCDGKDDDCDGVDSLGPDTDGDGSFDCFDCADEDPSVYPGAGDVCDLALDNDCDGVVDPRELDDDGDGVSECGGDCDDGNAAVLDQCAFLDLSISDAGGCGVRPNGTIECWGDQFGSGWLTPIGTFTQVAVTSTHGCGLRVGFGLECWDASAVWSPASWGLEASLLVPAGAGVCANQADGRIACESGDVYLSGADEVTSLAGGLGGVCWTGDLGQLSCVGAYVGAPPVGVGPWSDVAVGAQFGCGLQADGVAACWGPFEAVTQSVPSVPFTSLEAGRSHVCGLAVGGEVACWGLNGAGQSSPPDGLFISVHAGGDTSCATRPGGVVACWGANDAEQFVPAP